MSCECGSPSEHNCIQCSKELCRVHVKICKGDGGNCGKKMCDKCAIKCERFDCPTCPFHWKNGLCEKCSNDTAMTAGGEVVNPMC